MEGACSSGATYQQWEAKRRFIAELIDRDGTLLDIGCANGFFLLSLQEWSGHQLVPYGVDIRSELITQAIELFPKYNNHFCLLDALRIQTASKHGLPNKYDFIFWNFLGRWNIGAPEWQTTLRHILSMAKRRVILGFYGTNQYTPYSNKWQNERDRLLLLPATFERAGFALSGYRLNPTQYNQVVAWIDRK